MSKPTTHRKNALRKLGKQDEIIVRYLVSHRSCFWPEYLAY